MVGSHVAGLHALTAAQLSDCSQHIGLHWLLRAITYLCSSISDSAAQPEALVATVTHLAGFALLAPAADKGRLGFGSAALVPV